MTTSKIDPIKSRIWVFSQSNNTQLSKEDKKISSSQCLYFSFLFGKNKQCVLSQLHMHTSITMFSMNTLCTYIYPGGNRTRACSSLDGWDVHCTRRQRAVFKGG
jgi:hypothetical protein